MGTNSKYIVFLQGPLHSGKTIAAYRLRNIHDSIEFKQLMVTTRDPRIDDVSLKRSLSNSDFKNLTDSGKILAPHKVGKYHYGIDISKLEEVLSNSINSENKVIATYEVGVESAHKELFDFKKSGYSQLLKQLEKKLPGISEDAPRLEFVLLVTSKNSLHTNLGNRFDSEIEYNAKLAQARTNKAKELLQFLRPRNFKLYTSYADTFQKIELKSILKNSSVLECDYVSSRHTFEEYKMLSSANKVGKFDQPSVYHILNLLYQDGSYKEVLLNNLAVIADAAIMNKEIGSREDKELRSLKKSMHYLYNLTKKPIINTLAKSLEEFQDCTNLPTLRYKFFDPKLKKLTDYDLSKTGIKDYGLSKAIRELFVEENFFDGNFIYQGERNNYKKIASDNLIRNLLFTQHESQLSGLELFVAQACLEDQKLITDDALKLLDSMNFENRYWISRQKDHVKFLENNYNTISSIFRSKFKENLLAQDIKLFLKIKNKISNLSNSRSLGEPSKVIITDLLSSLYSNSYLKYKLTKSKVKISKTPAGIRSDADSLKKGQLVYVANIHDEEEDLTQLFFDKKLRKKLIKPLNKKLKKSHKNNRIKLKYLMSLLEDKSITSLRSSKRNSRFLANIESLFTSEIQNIVPLTLFRETNQLNYVQELEKIKNSGSLRVTYRPFIDAVVSSITHVISSHDKYSHFSGSVLPIVYRQDVTYLNLIKGLLVDISKKENESIVGKKILKSKRFNYLLTQLDKILPAVNDVNLDIARKGYGSKSFTSQLNDFYHDVQEISLNLAINFNNIT